MSSDLLFRRDFWSACRMNSFSANQSGHLLAPFRYGGARYTIDQVIRGSIFASLQFHTALESSVAVRLCCSLKE